VKSILEELYYGNIDPQSRCYLQGSHIFEVSSEMVNIEESLNDRLDGKEKEMFKRYVEAYAELMAASELDAFIVGFRLGARFAMDTFMSDEAPFREING